MMQRGSVFLSQTVVQFELPSPERLVLPGVRWGAIDAFPTPAYWAYQVLARRVSCSSIRYRLGETLAEEVGACLLGGHGIPSNVGLAAFKNLKSKGAFASATKEDELLDVLSRPLEVNGKAILYRFARQKSRYIASALSRLAEEVPPTGTGRELRDWLLALPGIGYKTASWITRNWLDADDVAILDIHVLRAGALAGFFEPELTVERDYLQLEEQFLKFSSAIGVRASELDAVIWLEMMSSSATVRNLFDGRLGKVQKGRQFSRRTAHKRHADANQACLID